jgi:hypothetical protein
MKRPEWVSDTTLVDTYSHPCRKVWIEEHHSIVDDEKIFLVCEFGVADKAYLTLAAASNSVGEQCGFNDNWKRI